MPQQPSHEDLAALVAVQARVIAELRAEVAAGAEAITALRLKVAEWSGSWVGTRRTPAAFLLAITPVNGHLHTSSELSF